MPPKRARTSLTTTQINRLLRPLRQKCARLAKVMATNSLPISTSASSSSTNASEPQTTISQISGLPPLTRLPSPANLCKRIYFDKSHREVLELSQTIYAIRDCFQDVVQKSRTGVTTQPMKHNNRLAGLAILCSMATGEDMQIDSETVSQESDLNPNDELYQAVPLQLRGWTLLAHALNLILEMCPRNVTLLSILLDLTLSYNLPSYLSEIPLRALLDVSTNLATVSQVPLLSHPAHSDFLVDLQRTCSRKNIPAQSFARILIQVDGARQIAVWESKAAKRLLAELLRDDFTSFMTLVGYCTTLFCAKRIISKLLESGKIQNRLCRWINFSSDHYSAIRHVKYEDCAAVQDFLMENPPNVFSQNTNLDKTNEAQGIQHAIVRLATHWLSSSCEDCADSAAKIIVKRLSVVAPSSDVYNSLICSLYANETLENAKCLLGLYAATLHSHKLFGLQASLWSCALRFIEEARYEQLLARGTSPDQVREYRLQLITLVENSEYLFYGRAGSLSAGYITPGRTTFVTNQSLDWTWEPMVMCWIQKNTERRESKRRRLQTDLPKDKSESVKKLLPRSGLSSSGSNFADISSGSFKMTAEPSKNCKFAHRLSDALKQRIILHPSSRNEESISDDEISCDAEIDYIGPHGSFLVGALGSPRLYSDDVLDLFAYHRSPSPEIQD